jgi:hypothetical protein
MLPFRSRPAAWTSAVPSTSYQVTTTNIPTNAICTPASLLAVLVTATPSVIHCGDPAASMRRAYTSATPLRRSFQVTTAPPDPSDVNASSLCSPVAVQSATPSGVHCGAPSAFTRCT